MKWNSISTDIAIEYRAAEGWAGIADRGTQVAIDARITDELALEGIARDLIRLVQDHRKTSGLNIEEGQHRGSICTRTPRR